MKLRLSIPAFILLISLSGYSQTSYQQVEIKKADSKKNHCIEIPSSFSHEQIAESKLINGLQSKKIQRVELIYTRYKENEHFDQNKLNEDRMYRLSQLLPKLQTDKPEIVWIEQTGATTREEAKTYFHGFRIYTGKETAKETFSRIVREDKGNLPSLFTVDNSKGGTFSHPNGSQIYIPENAVVYENGKPVFGNYTISYTEYRNAAEILFSGLPMEFKDKTGSYLFNSAGMYEIRGTKDGRELALQKDITIDFNCTKNEAGVNFYEMNDQTGEWTLLRNDLFTPTAVSQQKNVPVMHSKSEYRVKREIAPDTEYPDNPQYSNIVSGLISSNFGVYNCDQIYRVANKISISPKFLDASTKKQIKDQSFVCLIDKEINASFTFTPKEITCNSQGENVFLLFTKDGKTYLIKSEKDKQIDQNQKEPEFLMENITDKIKTSDDLKNYLAI
ncbi:MAG: hypothetical protein K0S23_18 [Fluviicola sp.]|jgi:hypothetical protein|uniref:hypothetical protein n=1 Tax=Fluviicola sp. TaxID=1917219 RepID=UPI00260F010F|nr:hypothetical protein [Fluviicola sp.]MDF3025711.1 hypothetical protein [Fluviicola sp.]